MGCFVVLGLGVAAIAVAMIGGGAFRWLYLAPIPLIAVSVWWAIMRPRWGKSLRRWIWYRLGWGKSVAELACRLGVTEQVLRENQPHYSLVQIPKRKGGTRTLHVPDAATMELQRSILRRLLARLRVHPAAHAFERGCSIVSNAQPHVRQAVVVKMDVVDFFPTTSATRISTFFRAIGWNREAAALLVKWTTHAAGLPQGAPTSPKLSNLVNYRVDLHLARWVARLKGAYTRYADDVTVSFPEDWPRKVRGTMRQIRRIFRGAGYRMHGRAKGGIFRSHQRQEVTGLVVNHHVALSRERRRWLRAVRHRHRQGVASTLTAEQLAGWEAYGAMIAQGQAAVPEWGRGQGDRGTGQGRRHGPRRARLQ